MKVVDLVQDSPRSQGQQIGECFRKQIRSLFHDRLARLTEFESDSNKVYKFLSRCISFHEKYSKSLFEEMKGIAEASELSIEEIILLNGYTDIMDLFLSKTVNSGCTAFTVQGKLASEIFLGQTWDFYKNDKDYVLLLRVKKNDTQALIFTLTGCLGLIGFNNRGIGVAINNIFSIDPKEGVVLPVIIRNILYQDKLENAISCLMDAELISGHHYLIGGTNGRFASIETTGKHKKIVYLSEDIYVHTNHYKFEELKPFERPVDSQSSTFERHNRMEKLLKASSSIDDDILKKYLADHENSPYSICVHNLPEGVETGGAVIMNLSKRYAWFLKGNPCQEKFCLYSLNDK